MPEKQAFQIPQELREFAENNVEQARVAYGQHGIYDTILRAAGARAWQPHGGGMRSRKPKG